MLDHTIGLSSPMREGLIKEPGFDLWRKLIVSNSTTVRVPGDTIFAWLDLQRRDAGA